jgi:hypothetical protein
MGICGTFKYYDFNAVTYLCWGFKNVDTKRSAHDAFRKIGETNNFIILGAIKLKGIKRIAKIG